MAEIEINPKLIDALRECARYSYGPYWWRRASMKKLAAMGLVEGYVPKDSRTSIAYRVTDAGRAALAKATP